MNYKRRTDWGSSGAPTHALSKLKGWKQDLLQPYEKTPITEEVEKTFGVRGPRPSPVKKAAVLNYLGGA